MVVATKPTMMERASVICNLIFHQSMAVVTVFLLWTYSVNFVFTATKASYTQWHALLCTIAYIPLMGEAIILFASDNVWTARVDRTVRYALHGALLAVSGVLATAGIALLIVAKDDRQSAHFTSTHGWTGLVSWVLVLLSQVLGVASANAQLFKPLVRPVVVKFAHNLLGQLGYVFGVVSLCYGLNYGFVKQAAGERATVASWYVMGFVTFWSLIAAFRSCYEQMKGMFA